MTSRLPSFLTSPVTITLLVVLGLGALVLLWGVASYNGLVGLDEGVTAKWANVEADYQRRADLIPNLVATVEANTDYEGSVLRDVTAARSAWAGAKASGDTAGAQAAANAMDSALGRLIAVAEAYPQLRANEAFLGLQDELAGTENRIKVSRVEYNNAIQAFNTRVRVFPSSIIAGMFGFERKTPFEAQAGAEDAPDVGDLFAN